MQGTSKPLGTIIQISRLKTAVACLAFILPLMVTVKTYAQYNFTIQNGAAIITGYAGPGGAITIPATLGGAPVTTIANGAFGQNSTLTNVTIPGTVTTVGANAFGSCPFLTNVTLLDGVLNIGDSAFGHCASLMG